MNYRLPFAFLFVLFSFTFSVANSLEDFLNSKKEISWEKINTPKNFKNAYKLKIKQPLDHSDTAQGFFFQTVFLNHKGKSDVTVLITEGYERQRNGVYEITQLVNGNQIDVEHRFFGESVPDSMIYKYLNLKQVTADLHHIFELFKSYYSGSWLSSGISKGGQTTIFYRFFYPNDMQAWVPYVAPFNLSLEDKRIYEFFDTIGTKECRESIYKTQIRVLSARDTIMPLLKQYVEKANLTFTYLTLEQAFEYMVLEYPFSFWQWGFPCSGIPEQNAKLSDVFTHVLRVCDISFFADLSMKMYGSHYYQAAAEMGYYGYEIDEFKDYIKALPKDKNPLATFTPDKMPVTFNDSLVHVVFDWLKENGNNMIYIYGGIDTWSATSVPPSKQTNSVWFKLAGRDHSTARIANMNLNQLDVLVNSLNSWLGTSIKIKKAKEILITG